MKEGTIAAVIFTIIIGVFLIAGAYNLGFQNGVTQGRLQILEEKDD